jgi:short-subunit dehydrogenase
MERVKKYCLIVGGSGGIGSEIAKKVFEKGLIPIITYNNNRKKAEKIAEEIGGICLKIDLNKSESILRGVDYLNTQIIKNNNLEILILAASPPPEIESFLNINRKYFEELLRVNVIGNAEIIREIIKKFFNRAKRGQVIAILTQAMENKNAPISTGMSSYVISKYGLEAVLKSCAVEHKWLKFTTFSPGLTDTQMLKVFDQRYLEMINAKQSIEKPSDVATNIVNGINL